MTVGFEETYVEIEEDTSKLELCVSISELSNANEAQFEFQLEVSTEDVTACELVHFFNIKAKLAVV